MSPALMIISSLIRMDVFFVSSLLQAMSLLHQAKQVFLSLKSNQMYSESELAAWRQKNLVSQSPAKLNGKFDGSKVGSGSGAGGAAPTTPQRPSAPARKKIAAKTGAVAAATSVKSTTRQRAARESNGAPGRRARKGKRAVH